MTSTRHLVLKLLNNASAFKHWKLCKHFLDSPWMMYIGHNWSRWMLSYWWLRMPNLIICYIKVFPRWNRTPSCKRLLRLLKLLHRLTYMNLVAELLPRSQANPFISSNLVQLVRLLACVFNNGQNSNRLAYLSLKTSRNWNSRMSSRFLEC